MSTRLDPWVVAFNLPTKTWTSGGSPSEYDQEWYDVFTVHAATRDHAEQLGRARRNLQCRITASQKRLLKSLHQAVEGEPVRTVPSIEIQEDERRGAARLAAIGLVALLEDRPLEVRLTSEAYNPSLVRLLDKPGA